MLLENRNNDATNSRYKLQHNVRLWQTDRRTDRIAVHIPVIRDTDAYRGVARILHWGPQKLSAEGARIEAPRRVGIGEGCPPPKTIRESGGASWAPSGVRGPL